MVLVMRDRSFRRKQEARHYMGRLKFYQRFGNFGKSWYEIGDSFESKRVYIGEDANRVWTGRPRIAHSHPEIGDLQKLRWTKKLRRGNVKMKILNSQDKKRSNRILRHFLKTVPWNTPAHLHWPKRSEIYRPGYYEDTRL